MSRAVFQNVPGLPRLGYLPSNVERHLKTNSVVNLFFLVVVILQPGIVFWPKRPFPSPRGATHCAAAVPFRKSREEGEACYVQSSLSLMELGGRHPRLELQEGWKQVVAGHSKSLTKA